MPPPTTTRLPAGWERPGCGSFDSQADSQLWFDRNDGFGERLDGNGDGIACSVGDDCCPWGSPAWPLGPNSELTVTTTPVTGNGAVLPIGGPVLPPTVSVSIEPTRASEDPDLCRLKDQRDINRNPYTFWEPMLDGVDYGTRFRSEERGMVQVSSQFSTGFPLSPDVLSPVGTVTFALLAIDFPDAVGTDEQLENARVIAGEVDAWFDKMSQGRFKIDWRFGDRVFRVPSHSGVFGLQTVASVATPLAIEIMEVADPYVDFSGVTMMWTLPPPTIREIGQHFHQSVQPVGTEGNATIFGPGSIMSDEGPIAGWGGPGMYIESVGADHWAYYVHETLHSVGGMPDIYLGNNKVGTQPFDYSWAGQPMDDWGMMSNQDGGSQTLISWHRWLLGWLDEDQVYCLPAEKLDSVEVTLVPMERAAEGFKTAMIPVSDRMVIVVESRREEGYDSDLSEKITVGYYDEDGVRRRSWLRDYGTSGVIVYTYDTSVHDFNGQARLQVPAGRVNDLAMASCPVEACTEPGQDLSDPFINWDPDREDHVLIETGYDPLLRQGDSVTVEGVTIELVEWGDYDRVRITR